MFWFLNNEVREEGGWEWGMISGMMGKEREREREGGFILQFYKTKSM